MSTRELTITRRRESIRTLDDLPYPDRSKVDYDRYFKYPNEAGVSYCITLQGTRGCPYGCTYCHKIWPKTHAYRSAENILDEIRLYYEMGVKRFALIDDIFNLNVANSSRFFEGIVKRGWKVQLFFPNGTRGDLMTKDYLDLMVEAGAVNIPMALETASPRLQKLIQKNLDLSRLHDNVTYLVTRYPDVISSLFFMVGFPTETEEEAWETLAFVKSIEWLHFPELHALTIYPGTEMAAMAETMGVSREVIERNAARSFHELPETLPFADKTFVPRLRTAFLRDYWLNQERMKRVLPGQMKAMTERELVQLYNSFLRTEFRTVHDICEFWGISRTDIPVSECLPEDAVRVDSISGKIRRHFAPVGQVREAPTRLLLLDLTHAFSGEQKDAFTGFAEPPLGLMYLSGYLGREFGRRIETTIAKSFVDFDSFDDMMRLVEQHRPHVVGVRGMSCFREFLYEGLDRLNRAHPRPIVILGGPHATSSFREVTERTEVDLVVVGEGERTLAELLRAIQENGNALPDAARLAGIDGIVLRAKPTELRDAPGLSVLGEA